MGPDLPPATSGDPSARTVAWVYPYGQYELAVLNRLVREAHAANRWVHYSDNIGAVEELARFRRCVQTPGPVHLRVTGPCRVLLDGVLVAESAGTDVTLTLPAAARELVVEVRTDPGVPAAVAVMAGEDGLAPSGWEAWTAAWDWVPSAPRAGSEDVPPHDAGPDVVVVEAQAVDGLVELLEPVLGRPVLEAGTGPDARSALEPVVSSGESLAEALAGPGDHQETRHDVVRRPDGRWTTRHALGFRYLAIRPPVTGPVTIETSVHPLARRGSFRCSDEVLDAIWSASADTLHLCLQGLVLDGIKRDRLPWAGDLASTALSSAYAFGTDDVVRDTWVALGQHRHGHVNGISDYTLWWLVTGAVRRRHFAAAGETEQAAAHVHRVLEGLVAEVGADGVLRPGEHAGQFARVFIDWGVTTDDDRDPTALQMLWSWALASAVTVLTAAGHPAAGRWAALAATLERTLRARAWDAEAQTWREYLDDSSPSTPYANLLAVLAGLHTGPDATVRDVLLAEPVGTPFMTGYSLRALALVGGRADAVARIRRLWGAMLDRGARTFWEEFPHGTDPGADLAMYGRPYGKSLCHAWSSGPAALLPELVLGIHAVEDAWSAFVVEPELGDLAWAEAVVPVPTGEIRVRCDGAGLVVDVPPGSTLVRAGRRHDEGRHRFPASAPVGSA
jgi:hypothetical protein